MSAIRRAGVKVFSRVAIKRPAAKLSLNDLAAKLEESGKMLERRYGTALDSVANREKLRHITGMERWGQSRLEGFLGQAVVADEYDSYQPSANASWRDLKLAFVNTRRKTVALTRQLAKENIGDERKIAHNEQGDLNAREWLYYLRFHADLESRQIK